MTARNYNNSADQRLSRYVQGGTTDRYINRLGWWERRNLQHSPDDITYTVTKRTEHRPDLIAYDLYNKPILAWLILQYNNIVDVTTELVEGTVIKAPSHRRLMMEILTLPTGGNKVNV